MSVTQRSQADAADKPDLSATIQLYHEMTRTLERIHRRFMEVVRIQLSQLGVDDISPVQMLMLTNIGGDELSVRALIERGYYLGSNASYNLKHLVETGYVDRAASQRDRRSARLRLTAKGLDLCAQLRRLEAAHAEALIRSDVDAQEFEVAFRTMRRLERTWTDVLRYEDLDLG